MCKISLNRMQTSLHTKTPPPSIPLKQQCHGNTWWSQSYWLFKLSVHINLLDACLKWWKVELFHKFWEKLHSHYHAQSPQFSLAIIDVTAFSENMWVLWEIAGYFFFINVASSHDSTYKEPFPSWYFWLPRQHLQNVQNKWGQ